MKRRARPDCHSQAPTEPSSRTLYLMQGLPASGKTTRAQQILHETGYGVRINRDLLRTMLHFDTFGDKYERFTRNAATTLVQYFLQKTALVIIDDCNLAQGVVRHWQELATDAGVLFQIERLETPLDECLRRNALRAHPVDRSLIVTMARAYGLYVKGK